MPPRTLPNLPPEGGSHDEKEARLKAEVDAKANADVEAKAKVDEAVNAAAEADRV